MSKRKADDSGKRKKYSKLTGFSKDITPTRLKKLRSHPHKGDWRRDIMIRISYRDTNITWNNTKTNEEFLIKTPVPCGMTGLIVKLHTQSGRSWESLPVSVKTYFDLKEKSSFDLRDFEVEVSVTGMRIKLCQYFFSLSGSKTLPLSSLLDFEFTEEIYFLVGVKGKYKVNNYLKSSLILQFNFILIQQFESYNFDMSAYYFSQSLHLIIFRT